MTPVLKLAAFAAVLAVVFGAAALAGAAIGPEPERPSRPPGRGEHGEMARRPTRSAASPSPPTACASSSTTLSWPAAASRRSRFRIVDERGATVRDFDVEHDQRMHLIVARRDLTGFQHLHPEQAADGTLVARPCGSTPPAPTALFADFAHDGEARDAGHRPARRRRRRPAGRCPRPRARAVSDGGYDVRLDAGAARPGEEADLRFTITRDGEPVRTEPYLGAGGHLVALREGDLAFLHVHPLTERRSVRVRRRRSRPPGRYRLFLQFQHDGRVHTAAFTQEVQR